MYADRIMLNSSGDRLDKPGPSLNQIEYLLEIWSLVDVFALVTLGTVPEQR